MPGGRPKKEIDMSLVTKLAKMQCTQEEIAFAVGVSVDTLQRNNEFCGIYKRGMEEGKASLRRMQWKAAEEGNTTMLVWLGKQYLGQSDKQNLDIKDTTDQERMNRAQERIENAQPEQE